MYVILGSTYNTKLVYELVFTLVATDDDRSCSVSKHVFKTGNRCSFFKYISSLRLTRPIIRQKSYRQIIYGSDCLEVALNINKFRFLTYLLV